MEKDEALVKAIATIASLTLEVERLKAENARSEGQLLSAFQTEKDLLRDLYEVRAKLSELEAREAVYVEALEFYANPGVYEVWPGPVIYEQSGESNCQEVGTLARQALSPTPNKAQKILEAIKAAIALVEVRGGSPPDINENPDGFDEWADLREAIESLIQEDKS